MKNAEVKALNEQLLAACTFQHIQAAVDAVKKQGTNIYVLPGHLPRGAVAGPRPAPRATTGGIVDYDAASSAAARSSTW